MIENFATEDKAVDVETFFRDHAFPGTERAVQQAVEGIRINQAWIKRDLGDIHEFLKSFKLA